MRAAHGPNCSDPCHHDSECPHGRSWTAGEECVICEPQVAHHYVIRGLLNSEEHERLYRHSPTFKAGVDAMVQTVLPTFILGLAAQAEEADRQHRLHRILLDTPPPVHHPTSRGFPVDLAPGFPEARR